jgi:broad specificity phosphatase PhoE
MPLSDAGRGEAAALAERLAAELPSDAAVLSSPAVRALETARAIQAGRSIEGARAIGVTVLDDLREVDFGGVEGLTWAELERDLPEVAAAILENRPVDWPNGERASDVEGRARSVRDQIEAASTPLILVSHGGLLAALIRALTGTTDQPASPVAPATDLAFVRSPGGWRVAAPRTA